MQLVTTSGHCGVIDMGMAIDGGHISATSGKFVMHKIFLNRRGQDQWRGRPAPSDRHRLLHADQGQGQVERHRTLGRLLRLLRSPPAPDITRHSGASRNPGAATTEPVVLDPGFRRGDAW